MELKAVLIVVNTIKYVKCLTLYYAQNNGFRFWIKKNWYCSY